MGQGDLRPVLVPPGPEGQREDALNNTTFYLQLWFGCLSDSLGCGWVGSGAV